MDQDLELKKIADAVSDCKKCDLCHSRDKGVPGEGPPDAEIMFIGEGPGFHENMQGRPFVGAAGNLLVELLSAIGMNREQVFITNVVKCRPPGNRDPQPEELQACNPYLEKQIQIINPKVIVTLGRFSMARFIQQAKISDVHGQPVKVNGMLVVPFFHPAAALHRPSLRPVVEKDFAKLPDLIRNAQQAPLYQPEEPLEDNNKAEQLSLF
ncbi:MAG: uracil-DNA glycosylase [Chloroflexota bacterium]|nr:MAG: uracil-DNA glycosylase [Chloroflexota bacterium]HDD62050.1 uracil-DNA glycosylase [Chloroflexota bacterium]